MAKTYDSTVARMAGNIAAGLVSQIQIYRYLNLNETSTEVTEAIAEDAVRIARQIIAEIERPEPQEKV